MLPFACCVVAICSCWGQLLWCNHRLYCPQPQPTFSAHCKPLSSCSHCQLMLAFAINGWLLHPLTAPSSAALPLPLPLMVGYCVPCPLPWPPPYSSSPPHSLSRLIVIAAVIAQGAKKFNAKGLDSLPTKALDLLHRAMCAVLYQRTAAAIKTACKVGPFFCRPFVCCCPGSRWGNTE